MRRDPDHDRTRPIPVQTLDEVAAEWRREREQRTAAPRLK